MIEKHKIKNFLLNTRALSSNTTGVQRYLLSYLPFIKNFRTLSPKIRNQNLGHIWEQLILPKMLSKSDLLWSPCNTGPIKHSNQVITIHDIAVIEHPEWFRRFFSMWYRFLWAKLLTDVKHIITVSEYSKNKIVKRYNLSPDKVTVIHAALDIRFKNYDSNVEREKNVLFVGSLSPRKNVNRLLKAWEGISTKHKDYKLLIVGSKSRVSSNEELLKDISNVEFTGRITDDELIALYRKSSMFIFPSLYEGFGLPPLEAMSQGCPVITSNVTSLPEVCGNAALYVNPLDVNDIANKIDLLISDKNLQKKLSEKGLDRSKKFYPDKLSLELNDLFNSLL